MTREGYEEIAGTGRVTCVFSAGHRGGKYSRKKDDCLGLRDIRVRSPETIGQGPKREDYDDGAGQGVREEDSLEKV